MAVMEGLEKVKLVWMAEDDILRKMAAWLGLTDLFCPPSAGDLKKYHCLTQTHADVETKIG